MSDETRNEQKRYHIKFKPGWWLVREYQMDGIQPVADSVGYKHVRIDGALAWTEFGELDGHVDQTCGHMVVVGHLLSESRQDGLHAIFTRVDGGIVSPPRRKSFG